tara:strand:- start:35 stop:487 length:453 start_codon:yes stop_codon:yes gene_type:complete
MNYNEMFTYEDGDLFWAVSLSNRAPVGSKAGTVDDLGYMSFRTGGRKHMHHRVIWEMFNGSVPEGCIIDHKDRNPSNNKIDNLRLGTPQQNSWNAKANGYCFVKSRGKYVARLNQKHLGYYDTAAKAKEVYEEAALGARGEWHNKEVNND